MLVESGYFKLCENQRFSLVFFCFCFLLSDSRCMSDAITSTKLVQTGSMFGQPMLFECMSICVWSPAHESEMRGYLVYVPIVKYLSQ